MKRIRRLTIVAGLCVVVGAVQVAPAVAQSPAADGYDETSISTFPPLGAPPISPESPPDGPPAAPQTPAGPPRADERLPFTGLGLPLIALLGGMLVAAGLLMRGRRRTPVA